MNQVLSSVSSPIHHNNLNISTREQVVAGKTQQAVKADKIHHHNNAEQKGEVLDQAVKQFPVQHKINDDRSLKAFAELSNSLEKALDGATPVDAQTADKEITEGGVRRIGKDLSKLFKGMGLDPHLAKQLSRSITASMQQEGVEQVDFSLTVTRSFSIDAYQLQDSYTGAADAAGSVQTAISGLQMSAVQTRSFDFSLNLSTGEYSLSRSQTDSFSIAAFDYQTQTLPTENPAETADQVTQSETTDEAMADGNTETAADVPAFVEGQSHGDIDAFFMSRTSLIEISQQVRKAPIVQAFAEGNDESVGAEIEAAETAADAGLAQMQDLYDQLGETSEQPANLFESLTQIRNLRIEEEQSVRYLRFSFEAFAPVGLAATNDQGYQTTLYPRPDGSLGVAEEKPVQVEA
ncbi:MAG: hypothetical protein JXQ81_06675 [Desulfuromonadales bacterium]|nr:hypothetical protein [Desulfuromonadales bacterium]MBN2792173.1 hypothetical protein [Desulfuromonadales bacterium]